MTFDLCTADDPRLERSEDLGAAIAHLRAAQVTAASTEHREQVLAYVAAHEDAAWRSSAEGHLTGSALVVDATGERTLLMLHRKLGRWFQPGGHADGDTNLPAVALREATEETGVDGLRVAIPAIDVDVHRVEPPAEAAHLHLDVRYLVLAPPGATEVGNEESVALRWVGIDDLPALRPPVDEGTVRLVHRGLEVARSVIGTLEAERSEG
jgi:8-oxo-dGTP pyrophosphatase MutT (NUDIX family)